VATDLANLIGSNHSVITSTIDNLQVVAADVQNNQQQLASSLSTLGAGLAPYIQISQWGSGSPSRPSTPAWPTRPPARTTNRPIRRRDRAWGAACPHLKFGQVVQPSTLVGGERRQRHPVAPTSIAGMLRAISGQGALLLPASGRVMKAFTERRPKVIGVIAVAIILAGVLAILFLNRSIFTSGYTSRHASQRGRHHQGNRRHGGRRQGGNGHRLSPCTEMRSTPLSVNHSVQLPHDTDGGH
jgi:hypothetical protein